MSTAAIVTRGFLFSAALVVTAGYNTIPANPLVTPPVPPPPLLTTFQSAAQIAVAGIARTEPIPIPPNDAPVLQMGADGQPTALLDPAWRLYLIDRDAYAVQAVDQEYPVGRFGEAATAVDLALGAMDAVSRREVQALIESAVENAARPVRGEPDADLAPPSRSWSTFTLIQDTAANVSTYPAAAYPTALYVETDTFVLRRSDGSGWAEIISPALTKLLGSTSSFPALKRSGTTLQVRLADDTNYSALEVLDEVYGSGWNGKVEVPTKNAVYDEIEAVIAAVGVRVAVVDSRVYTNQGAVIGSTISTSTAGFYRFSYSLLDTTADVAAGTIQLSVGFTDDTGATTRTSAAVVLTGIGTTVRDSGNFEIRLASGNLTFQTVLGGAFGTAKYALYLTLEHLQ